MIDVRTFQLNEVGIAPIVIHDQKIAANGCITYDVPVYSVLSYQTGIHIQSSMFTSSLRIAANDDRLAFFA
ncbi:MAG TPA: hypothetical protein H9715_02610 [Candidatus Merdibacter merdigallinarum]|nr:hypothetical protein [Candidatus Merdibacter merdigallinarum]